MSKLYQARLLAAALAMLASCVNPESEIMAETCQMTTEVLAEDKSGPLKIEITGAPLLCIEPDGDANLAPFTATARISNAGQSPVTLSYTKSETPAFRSEAIWDRGQRDEAQVFTRPAASRPTRVEQRLSPGEALLISSWTRHHGLIWDAVRSVSTVDGDRIAPEKALQREFTVQFSLSIGLQVAGGAEEPVSRAYPVKLRAMRIEE